MRLDFYPVKRSFGSVFLFRADTWALVGWALFGMSWLLPNHYRPWTSFHSEALSIVGTLAITAALVLDKPSRTVWPILLRWVSVIALLPWVLWLGGVGFFVGDAVLCSYCLVGWAIAIFVGAQLAQSRRPSSILTLMVVLWISAILSAAIGLAQWLHLDELLGIFAAQIDIGDPVMGNLAQPNQFSTFLLIGILAYTYTFERYVIGWFTYALGTLFMTFVMVLAHSRAGLLSAVVLGCFYWLKHVSMKSRLSSRHILLWLALLAALSYMSPYFDRWMHLEYAPEPLFTANGRLLIWSQVLAGIAESPWFGYGWNQTVSAFAVGAIKYPGEAPYSFAHTVLLDLVAWNGVPIGLALIVLGGYWSFTRVAQLKGQDAFYGMACLLPFAVHSLVEFSYAYAYFLMFSGFMIGIIEASLGHTRPELAMRNWFYGSIAVFTVVGACIVYEYLLIEEDFRVVRFENLRVGMTDSSYKPPNIWMLSHMATMLKASRKAATPNMTKSELEELRMVALRFPYAALSLRYAIALGLNGDSKGAQKTMERVRGMYGTGYYSAALEVWEGSCLTYPQLKAVDLPKWATGLPLDAQPRP